MVTFFKFGHRKRSSLSIPIQTTVLKHLDKLAFYFSLVPSGVFKHTCLIP